MTEQVVAKSNKTNFSRLVAIELKNLMSVGYTRLEFEENSIINLVGYNDSGKSAVTRALEIIFYDEYSRDQVAFIKDGEEYFAIGLEFSDGIAINKYKYVNGQSEWEMLKGDEIIYTNRLQTGLAAMPTIPKPIAQYLSVVEDTVTGEKLNIRRNSDKLFLVGMSGGEVYKIINSVLQLDVLVATVKRLNEDRNDLQARLVAESTTLRTLRNEHDSLVGVTDEALNQLNDMSENLKANKYRVESLLAIDSSKQELDAICIQPELNVIDTEQLKDISAILEAKQSLDNAEQTSQPELTLVDMERLTMLETIVSERQKLDTPIPPELPVVDTTRLNAVIEVAKAYNNLFNINQEIVALDTEINTVTSELALLAQQHNFKVCKNCGTIAV